MKKSNVKKLIIGNPQAGIPGLQDDWWTFITPDIWNSHGSFLKDIAGSEYLDMCGFLSTAPIRFDHPRLRSKEFLDKLSRVGFYRPSLSDFWTEEMAEFVKSFREIATPQYMHHLFFIEGGALAVENALKSAFDWKVRLNIMRGKIKDDPQETLQPHGTKVIFFERGFHGRSGYTISITHTYDARKYKFFPKFNWFRVDPPVEKYDSLGNIINSEELQRVQTDAIEKIEKILDQHSDDIAAIIIEPIQCEGGDRHIPVDFFKKLRKLADNNDVILIYDEVQSGFGTTGKMWAHEYFGEDAIPDVVVFSKKAQIAGIMANYKKFSLVEDNVFSSEKEGKSRLNSTWGGNLVDMVRGNAYLQIIKEEDLLHNASQIGNLLLKNLQEICKHYHEIIENPRGRGMLLAFDIKPPAMRFELWKAFYDVQLLSLTCGNKTIRFRPHLDMTVNEANEAINRIEKGLAKFNSKK
jgi:L-lysine 6-transaminase